MMSSIGDHGDQVTKHAKSSVGLMVRTYVATMCVWGEVGGGGPPWDDPIVTETNSLLTVCLSVRPKPTI